MPIGVTGPVVPRYIDAVVSEVGRDTMPATLGLAAGGIAYLGYQFSVLMAEAGAVGAMIAPSAEAIELATPLLMVA